MLSNLDVAYQDMDTSVPNNLRRNNVPLFLSAAPYVVIFSLPCLVVFQNYKENCSITRENSCKR